jgi:hypothetical protein
MSILRPTAWMYSSTLAGWALKELCRSVRTRTSLGTVALLDQIEEPERAGSKAQTGIHLIDPVTCGLCHIAKSLFARFDCNIIGNLRLGCSKMGQQPVTHDPNISAGFV